MSKSEWQQLPENFRNAAINLFQMQGLDLEAALFGKEHDEDKEEGSPYLTRKEAAAYANVSTDTIDNWCAQGDIEKSKLGGGRAGAVRISRKSLDAFIKRCIVNCRKRVRKDLAPSVTGGYRA